MKIYPAIIIVLALFVAVAITSWAADIYEYGNDKMRILRLSDKAGNSKTDILIGDKDLIAKAAPSGICASEFVTFLLLGPDGPALIDTGWGEAAGGRTLSLLKKAGYQPEEIKHVFLTHLHPDHAGGMVANKARTFPNAQVHVAANEYDFWKNQNSGRMAKAAKEFLSLYGMDLQPFSDNRILPWLEFMPSPGHTPGHGAFVIEIDGKRYVIGGDTFHCLQVQAPHPEISVIYDVDPAKARENRGEFLRQVAEDGSIVLGSHFPAPGAVIFNPAPDKGYNYSPIAPR